MSASKRGLVLASLPGIAALLLFYSLALHMYRSLGGWPTSIGESGFPRALAIHNTITVDVFIVLFLSLFFLPVPFAVCLFNKRWRGFTLYLGVYAGALFLCFAVTQIAAPAEFLFWWRD